MNTGSEGENAEHVVFLGLYNADKFREKISNWLPNLDLSGTKLLVVDNCSTDSTESWMLKLLETLEYPYEYRRNEMNLGGYGSLLNNISGLGKEGWVTTLHQDDSYPRNHVQAHRHEIRLQAYSDLGMICTEAVSVDTDNFRLSFPRGNWLLSKEWDAVEIFLAHLRNHIFPFSGATFRVVVLSEFKIPWHSTAFPDTELVMKMIGKYRIVYSTGEPVQYLENPTSEFHSLDNFQREFGAFQALIRVFSHKTFEQICLQVSASEHKVFMASLRNGIELRIRDQTLKMALTQFAMERVAEIIGLNPTVSIELSQGYRSVGDKFAVEILSRLSGLPVEYRSAGQQSNIKAKFDVPRCVAKFVAIFIPLRLQKKLFSQIMRTRLGKALFPQWNFNWRDQK